MQDIHLLANNNKKWHIFCGKRNATFFGMLYSMTYTWWVYL